MFKSSNTNNKTTKSSTYFPIKANKPLRQKPPYTFKHTHKQPHKETSIAACSVLPLSVWHPAVTVYHIHQLATGHNEPLIL